MRYSDKDISEIILNTDKEVFLYKVTDKFGNNGVVVAAIVEYGNETKISEFTMNCRVMGRYIENAIIEDMENAARNCGYDTFINIYKQTLKNKPVENLYSTLVIKARQNKLMAS